MKRIVCLLVALVWTVNLSAQTSQGEPLSQSPQEILSRMETELGKHKGEGVFMSMEAKVPVLGTMRSKSWALGKKLRMEATMMGATIISWRDETTQWEYDTKSNEITIKPFEMKAKEGNDDLSDLSGLGEGYELAITEETETTWHIIGKRLKTNKEKDAPKAFEMTVAKGTYLPVLFTAKASGVRMTLRDIGFGVTESQVTFDPAAFPDAKIIDKR